MEGKNFDRAADEFLSGKYSEEEQNALSAWQRADASAAQDAGLDPEKTNQIRERLLQNIHAGIRQVEEENGVPVPGAKVRPMWGHPLLRVAAMLTLAVGLFWLMQYYSQPTAAPAVLVFQNTSDQPLQQVLPDGSVVWLNSQTELRLAQDFNQSGRAVFLKGEAFFEVAKNPEKPFTVDAGQISTRVLGTRFNVRAYDNDDQLEVSVLEGKVAVQSQLSSLGSPARQPSLGQTEGPAADYILTRDQKVTFVRESGELQKADVTAAVPANAWKDNRLVFDQATVGEVFKQISRKFNVPIVPENEEILNCVVRADLSGQSLETMMQVVCRLINAEYEQEGDRIMVKGEGCPEPLPDLEN